jgi:hypothetical protein
MFYYIVYDDYIILLQEWPIAALVVVILYRLGNKAYNIIIFYKIKVHLLLFWFLLISMYLSMRLANIFFLATFIILYYIEYICVVRKFTIRQEYIICSRGRHGRMYCLCLTNVHHNSFSFSRTQFCDVSFNIKIDFYLLSNLSRKWYYAFIIIIILKRVIAM